GRGRRAGVLGAGGAAPARAARALLPDARVVRGRRGRRAGDVPPCLAAAGDLRGAGDVPGLAVPDRHQSLPGPGRDAAAGVGGRWLHPSPARLLDELPAPDADEPETVAVARETIELAYLVAVQHLAPRPRAVLILRGVLGWPAKDVAELLGDSVNSVNSALQRARAGMREHLPAERQDWTGGEQDAGTRELVRRYTDASVATDVDGLA